MDFKNIKSNIIYLRYIKIHQKFRELFISNKKYLIR